MLCVQTVLRSPTPHALMRPCTHASMCPCPHAGSELAQLAWAVTTAEVYRAGLFNEMAERGMQLSPAAGRLPSGPGESWPADSVSQTLLIL